MAQAQADAIFELLAKFADYGFNKSQRRPTRFVAYQTAYMTELSSRIPGCLDDLDMGIPTSSPNSAPRRSGSASRSAPSVNRSA